MQLDGNISGVSSDTSVSSDDSLHISGTETVFDSDDEIDAQPIPANLFPVLGQKVSPGQPLVFDVNVSRDDRISSSSLPLCLMMNCRSVCNKIDNMREMLHTLGPSLVIASETWERETKRIHNILKSKQFKTISYFRKNKSPGGGCAILYDENRLRVLDTDIFVPENLEAIWSVFTPVLNDKQSGKVKRIAVGSIYISPKSKFKTEMIEHIIETIHILRAKYNNEISFCIGGDFNKVDISEILDCYGGLKQVTSIPTRKSVTLEILLSDLHSMYHPPTTLPPLQVDTDKKGKDSDHNIVVFAPKDNIEYKEKLKKKSIKFRPIPDSQVAKFEIELAKYPWDHVFEGKNTNQKAEHFHNFLRNQLDFFFLKK